MAAPLRTTRASNPAMTRTRSTAVARHLTVVTGRRRVARFVVGITAIAGVLMVGAIVLHTRLAERQLDIDRFNRDLREAQAEFDVLRAQRAELRSPTYLAEHATALGMVPGDESVFIDVHPLVLAVTIARTGEIPASVVGVDGNPIRDQISDPASREPMDQFRIVKSLSSESP